MKPTHTPIRLMEGPYSVKVEPYPDTEANEQPDVYVINPQGFHLCHVYNSEMQFIDGGREAQAAHIVKCVNLHDELVRMVADLEYYIDINCADPSRPQGRKAIELKNKANDILTRAKAAK